MISATKKMPFVLFLLITLFINWGCSETTYSTPAAVNIAASTKTFSPDFIETANFLETASMKNIIPTDIPTITATITPAPPGTFAFFFYSPLIMNYDPSIWEIKNVLQAKELVSCYLAEQGPTDFNGPHTSEVVQLGNVKYEVLSFPDSSQDVVSKSYGFIK